MRRVASRWACLSVVAASCLVDMSAAAAVRFVAVGWTDSQTGQGFVQRFDSEPPWAFDGGAIAVGSNPTLRFAGTRIYAVSDADGTITAIDAESWNIGRVYSLGATVQPIDIAVVGPDLGYVTTRASTALLRLNLATGVSEHALDLGGFEHPGGDLSAGMMAVDGGRLFAQVSRQTAATLATVAEPEPTGYLAVVDISSEQLVDVDPLRSGTQAIALAGTAPKYKMNLLRDMRRLYLSASGAFFDAGGLEAIDLDALVSLGLVVAEADGNTGADLGSFAMLAEDRGFLVSSTDLIQSSHLARFTLAGGAAPEELFVTVDYRVPTMVYEPRTNSLFVPDGGNADGVWVFDAASGEKRRRDPLLIGGPASDIELLCDPLQSCDCAVGYACAPSVPALSRWGLAALSLVLALVALLRGSRARVDRNAAPRPKGRRRW